MKFFFNIYKHKKFVGDLITLINKKISEEGYTLYNEGLKVIKVTEKIKWIYYSSEEFAEIVIREVVPGKRTECPTFVKNVIIIGNDDGRSKKDIVDAIFDNAYLYKKGKRKLDIMTLAKSIRRR